MIYLDHNATTPVKPAVRAAMMEAMERTGDPSSGHRCGRTVRESIEEARERVAALVGVKPAQVIFTSGGTEANNLAKRVNVASLMVSAIEHDSILASVPPHTQRIPVTADGVVNMLAAEMIFKTTHSPGWVAVMLVNNETGVIQPVAEIAQKAKAYGHLVHTDAVQAVGCISIDFAELGVDSMSISAHKIGGPHGVGALIVSKDMMLQPLLCGGRQERNRRAGTENFSGIVGFGVAAQLAADDLMEAPKIRRWRDETQDCLKFIAGEDAIVIGERAPRVANTLCIALRGISAKSQIMAMDLAGVAVGAVSGCSNGKVKTSHVLRAMGYNDAIAASALRISLGWNTEPSDLMRCIDAWSALYRHARHSAQLRSIVA
jgi:cysteine desulfurase